MSTQIRAPLGVDPAPDAHDIGRQLQKFVEHAWKQESRIDQLLAYAGTSRGWVRGRSPRLAQLVEVTWSTEITDPEFKKNLRTYHRLIAGAVGLCQRARCRVPSSYSVPTTPSPPPGVESLACRIEELAERIMLPKDVPLTLKVLLGRRFALEQLLVELGDPEYLYTRAAELYAELEGTVVRWRELFPDVTPWPEDASTAGGVASVDKTRWRVGQLLAAKEADDLPQRARRELKLRALYLLLAVFVIAVGMFAVQIWRAGFPSPWLAMSAGVTGAALGMLVKLRDELNRGAQIREFLPFSFAQLVIGATAGLVVCVLNATPVINLGGAGGVAAFAFAAGFSEAAFLRLLGRILDSGNPAPPPNPKGDTATGG
jgi:hypothetical protein